MRKLFYKSTDDFNEELIDKDKGNIHYFQLIISLLGLGSSFWTYLLHIQLKAQIGTPLVCDVNETINCSKIIGSAEGEIFDIPLGIWGMIYWLLATGLSVFPLFSNVSAKYINNWRLFFSGIGFISAICLIYISYFVLKGLCEFCTIVQATCIIYFILSLISFNKTKKMVFYAKKADFYRLVLMTICLSLIPLPFYFISKGWIYNYYKENHIPQFKIYQDEKYQVEIPFHPWLDHKEIDYSKGKDEAPVKIVEFTDFECPYCQLLHERLKSLKRYIDEGKVKLYFRNWPLNYHKYAMKLAIAARCAGEQNKFWEFTDWAFITTRKYATSSVKKDHYFSDKNLVKKINEFKLDDVKFKKCLDNKQIINKIKKDTAAAKYLAGSGTPFMMINMKPYKGNWMQPQILEKYINELLEKNRNKI